MSFHKTRIAVLRGGPSSEYEVSLKSGQTVLNNLNNSLSHKYHPIDIFISKDGIWHIDGMEKKPSEALKYIDFAFIAMHGQYGEDGKIQKILEHHSIPFNGSSSLISSLAMNKHLSKKTLSSHLKDKIKFAFHKIFSKEEAENKGAYYIFREIPIPAIVKPNNSGSSFGISIVKNFFDLEEALNKAFVHSDSVIIEEFIGGKEATCAVIDNFRDEKHYSLLPAEIVPHKGRDFFDYSAKYEGLSDEICPGNFDIETKIAIQEAAKAVHNQMGLRHYSRSDFIIHPKRGIYFLEVNTLPGLTEQSILPKSVNAIGLSMPDFLDHIVNLALNKK